jgi:hypothetical protein
MWKWTRKQLPKIPIVRDWVVSTEDSRERRKLRENFVPLIEKARREKRELDAQNLYAEWNHYQNQIDEPNYVEASNRLVGRARRVYVPVPDKPTRYDETKNDDWWFSDTTGDWALRHPTYQRLQREVLDAQRAANDEWRKWATFLFALAGLFLGWASFRAKNKQPDPCPRNYYRDDKGACVFALTPPPQHSPPAVQPAPAPAPVKPSPSKKKSASAKASKKQLPASQ